MVMKLMLRLPPRCLSINRVICYMLLLMVMGFSPFLMYDLYVRSVEFQFYNLHMEDSNNNISDFECIIPNYDPNDPSVQQYLKTLSSNTLNCRNPQPYLTFLDSEGFIHLNKTAIKLSKLNQRDFECTYYEIFRRNKTDNEYDLGIPQVFRETEKIHLSAYILVKCMLKSGKVIYETAHAYVPPPSKILSKIAKRVNNDENRPNILIFGLDSMSRLNFIRQLPRTYHFLTNILDSVVFKGMTKTGDNTFPNMMALLSGRNVNKRDNETKAISVDKPKYFDDIPLVWNSFNSNGYITMYGEDCPTLTIFNYLASGFKDQPTDYYLRPFWLAIDRIEDLRFKSTYCFGNTPKHIYLLEYIERFLIKMKHFRYFAFTFLTQLSHDDLNLVQVADSDYEKMLLKMWKAGLLNNTVVIVLGDHGNRFSKLRTTDIGRVEERMPFLAVSLPKEFRRKFPHLMNGLQENSNNLLSWFDFYEMLMDIANNNLGKESLVERYGTIGKSPFRWINKNRTCEQAGIPEEYCICARETQLPTNDSRIKKVAQDLMKHINMNLLKSNIEKGLCTHLKLSKILNAQQLSLGPSVTRPQGFRVLYRVMVEVIPSRALFEGTLELHAWSKNGQVIGDVNRINKYGNESHCITDRILQLYCFCTDLTK